METEGLSGHFMVSTKRLDPVVQRAGKLMPAQRASSHETTTREPPSTKLEGLGAYTHHTTLAYSAMRRWRAFVNAYPRGDSAPSRGRRLSSQG